MDLLSVYATKIAAKADMPNDYLEPDCRNLGLVLNRIGSDPMAKNGFSKHCKRSYEGIDDYYVQAEGGTVQVFFHEGRSSNSSHAPVRWHSALPRLLAILCHPSPPPLICIEEPELGLHPDVLPVLADLLKEASERTQLIVTTHSDVLVDAMTDQPESVLVAEKNGDGTTLTRLDSKQLMPLAGEIPVWVKLWTRGDIGGHAGETICRGRWHIKPAENRPERIFQIYYRRRRFKTTTYCRMRQSRGCL